MKILVKEIDNFKSKKFKGKLLTEYIVYQTINDIPIKADTVIGEKAKEILIAEYQKEIKN